MRIFIVPLLAGLLASGTALAAPGDPYLVYTANVYVDGAVIVRTDPATGALVEISRNGQQGTLFRRPYDLAVEADGTLVVADMGTPNAADGAVIRVDPLTGRQSLLASGGEFYDPAGIAVAPNGDIYVADNRAPDNDGAVIRVDPRSGAQTLVTSAGMLDLPFGIAVDRDGTLLVSNRIEEDSLPTPCTPVGRIVRVNPASGAQSAVGVQGGQLSFPLGLALEPDGGLLVANECQGAAGVVRLRPPGWAQSLLTANGSGDLLVTPERIALDPSGAPIVSDFNLGADGEGGIARVDPATGQQTLVRSGDLFNHPLGIASVVNRPPSAALALEPSLVAAGRPVRLNGSGSNDPEGLRLVYEWDLDGDTAFEAGSGTTSAVTRRFTRDGPATIRVRVNDPHGGSSVAEGVVSVDGSVPRITRLRAGARVLAVGRARRKRGRNPASASARPKRATAVRFRLSEPARVSMTVARGRLGRRAKGGSCRAGARRGRRCIKWTRARRIRRTRRGGANRLPLRARGLRPGRHRLTLTAVDAVAHRSTPRRLRVRVVRAR
jgi:sugar lactone lactonase YvrE